MVRRSPPVWLKSCDFKPLDSFECRVHVKHQVFASIHQILLWSHVTRFVTSNFYVYRKTLLMMMPAAQHVLESPIMWCKTTALPIGLYVQNANGENSLQFGAPCVFVVQFYILSLSISIIIPQPGVLYLKPVYRSYLFSLFIQVGGPGGTESKSDTTTLPCLLVPMTLPPNDRPWREGHMRTAWRSSHIHLHIHITQKASLGALLSWQCISKN